MEAERAQKQYEDVRQNETESRHVNASRYESDSRQPHEAGRIGGESSDEKYAQVNDAEAQKAHETYQAKFGSQTVCQSASFPN